MPEVEAKRRFCCTSGIPLAEWPLHDGKADGVPIDSNRLYRFSDVFRYMALGWVFGQVTSGTRSPGLESRHTLSNPFFPDPCLPSFSLFLPVRILLSRRRWGELRAVRTID